MKTFYHIKKKNNTENSRESLKGLLLFFPENVKNNQEYSIL